MAATCLEFYDMLSCHHRTYGQHLLRWMWSWLPTFQHSSLEKKRSLSIMDFIDDSSKPKRNGIPDVVFLTWPVDIWKVTAVRVVLFSSYFFPVHISRVPQGRDSKFPKMQIWNRRILSYSNRTRHKRKVQEDHHLKYCISKRSYASDPVDADDPF